MERRTAFSVVELLVVIAIISVLAAILLPTLEQSIEQSRRLSCAQNLRQIHLTTTGYAMDFHGRTPYYPLYDGGVFSDSCQYGIGTLANTGWADLIRSGYVSGALMACPSMDVAPIFDWNSTGLHYSFKYNSYRSISLGYNPISGPDTLLKLSRFRILDSKAANDPVFHEATPYRTGPQYTTLGWSQRKWAHIEGGNVLLGSGALRWIPTNPAKNWPHYYNLYSDIWGMEFLLK